MKSLIILFLFSTAINVTAQTDTIPLHRLEFSFSFGTTTSGPSSDFETALSKSGFDQTMQGWFGPPVKHPVSYTGFGQTGAPWTFTAVYNLDNNMAVGIDVGNSPIGITNGFRLDTGRMTFVHIYHTLFQIVPMLQLRYQSFYLKCGPAIYITKTNVGDQFNFNYDDNVLHLGLLLGGGLVYPSDTMFFGFADVQLRVLSADTLGPYETTASGASVVNEINSFDVNYSNAYVGIGIGLRL